MERAFASSRLSQPRPSLRSGVLRLRFLAGLFGDLLIVVGRIEFGAITTPCRRLDGAIDLAQSVGRHAQGHHLADAHHHVPAHHLDAGRRERLVKALLAKLRVDLLERLGLVVLEKDGEQERSLLDISGMLLIVRYAAKHTDAQKRRGNPRCKATHDGLPLKLLAAGQRGWNSRVPRVSLARGAPEYRNETASAFSRTFDRQLPNQPNAIDPKRSFFASKHHAASVSQREDRQ